VLCENKVIAIFDKSKLSNVVLARGREILEWTVGDLSTKDFIFVEQNSTFTEVCRQWMNTELEFAVVADDAY